MITSTTKISAVLVISLLLISLIPITVVQVQSEANEDPKFIRRIWGQETVGQKITHEYPLAGIEVFVRSNKTQTVTIEAVDEAGAVLASTSAAVSPTDQWVRLMFDKRLPARLPDGQAGTHTITLRAPSITAQADAVLSRFQIDSNIYSDGHMVVNGEESYGDLGFRALDRAPLWRAIKIAGQITDRSSMRGLLAATVGLMIAVAAVGSAKLPGRAAAWVPVALLFIGAIILRLPYMRELEGAVGGDAYNYLSKGHAVLLGEDPFASDPRKGPLFSFLAIPAFFTADPLLWSRGIGVVAAAAAAALTPLVARQLGISWSLAITSGVLVAVNPEFIFESANGLANTLYAALIVASVWAYLKARETHATFWIVLLSIFLGATFLTRFEGALMAVVLLPTLWFTLNNVEGFTSSEAEKLTPNGVEKSARLSWKQIVISALVAAALAAIPFTSYFWSGVSGVRSFSDIQSDKGLWLVADRDTFESNLSRAQGFFGALWIKFESLPPVAPPLLFGALAVGAIAAISNSLPRPSYTRAVLLVGLLIAVLLLIMMKSPFGRDMLILLTLAATGAGAVWVAFRGRPGNIAALVAVLLQIAIIVLILPKGRYFLPLVPFASIAIVGSLHALTAGGERKRWDSRTIIATFIAAIVATHVFVVNKPALASRIEEFNVDAQDNGVLVRVLKPLRATGENIGYFSIGDLAVIMYIPADRLFNFDPNKAGYGPDAELAWMRANDVAYIFERDREPQWTAPREYPESFELIRTATTPFGDSKVFVYKVLPE